MASVTSNGSNGVAFKVLATIVGAISAWVLAVSLALASISSGTATGITRNTTKLEHTESDIREIKIMQFKILEKISDIEKHIAASRRD